MGLEPPPSVMRAERLRKQGIGRGIKTGAKTATKDQERDYLRRFEELARDPEIALPEWRGSGSDPLARLRARMRRIHSKQASAFWLKWLGRGRRLDHAYAQTILALRAGKIPSFASLRFRNHDVKFVLRGRGLREKLAGLHNFEDPHVRLLAYVDIARAKNLVFVSHREAFFALRAGDALPPDDLMVLIEDAGLSVVRDGDRVRCPHAGEHTFGLEYSFEAPSAHVRLCRDCVRRLKEPLSATLELGITNRKGRIETERRVVGRLHEIHPESAQTEYDRLVEASGRAAAERAERFEGVSDVDLLEWADEEFEKRLQERPEGFLWVGGVLWLDGFDEAARRFASNEAEARALSEAFRRVVPRVHAGEGSFNRLIDPAWREHTQDLLRAAGADVLDPQAVADLARQRPSEAFAALARLLENEQKVAGYPRFAGLPTPLRLAHDLFKAHRSGDAFQFQRRLAEGIRDPGTKPLALALARAFGQGAGVEWQFAPHEKDQALFFEPAAHALAQATPETFLAALSQLAEACRVELPPPI